MTKTSYPFAVIAREQKVDYDRVIDYVLFLRGKLNRPADPLDRTVRNRVMRAELQHIDIVDGMRPYELGYEV